MHPATNQNNIRKIVDSSMSGDNNTVLATSGEMSELEEVAASRFFSRSPNLTCILQYLCRTALEGNAAEIKEYNVAVQALGRDSSFDPSRDSIVRVEISRLRKRLKQYYLTEGASHSIQIQLPESGYVPRFVNVAATAVEAPIAEPASVPPPAEPPPGEIPPATGPPRGKRIV